VFSPNQGRNCSEWAEARQWIGQGGISVLSVCVIIKLQSGEKDKRVKRRPESIIQKLKMYSPVSFEHVSNFLGVLVLWNRSSPSTNEPLGIRLTKSPISAPCFILDRWRRFRCVKTHLSFTWKTRQANSANQEKIKFNIWSKDIGLSGTYSFINWPRSCRYATRNTEKRTSNPISAALTKASLFPDLSNPCRTKFIAARLLPTKWLFLAVCCNFWARTCKVSRWNYANTRPRCKSNV